MVVGICTILLTIAFSSGRADSEVVPVPSTQSILTHRQQIWLDALEWCESGGNPKAYNPKDRDNTPSYGLLQFKPSTFYYFEQRYELGSSTDYTDSAMQEAITAEMIAHSGSVDFHRQFPDCVKRLGLPPQD